MMCSITSPLPRESLVPSPFPMVEEGWHGKPAVKMSTYPAPLQNARPATSSCHCSTLKLVKQNFFASTRVSQANFFCNVTPDRMESRAMQSVPMPVQTLPQVMTLACLVLLSAMGLGVFLLAFICLVILANAWPALCYVIIS